MINRTITLFLFVVMLAAHGVADTLPQFMFKTTSSMSGQLLTTITYEKLPDGGLELELTVTERGGMDAVVDRILVHVFDNDQEINTFESTISPVTIVAGQEVSLKERVNVSTGHWVSYELVVGDKSFCLFVNAG